MVIIHKMILLDLVIRKRNLASFYIFHYLLELRIESVDLDKRRNEIWLWNKPKFLPIEKMAIRWNFAQSPQSFVVQWGGAVLYLQHKELDHIHQLQKVQHKEFDPIHQVHKERISTK